MPSLPTATVRSSSLCIANMALKMFALLDAEFAMVIYDAQEDSFIAARDPIGIRPLYYGYTEGGAILFASEPEKTSRS